MSADVRELAGNTPLVLRGFAAVAVVAGEVDLFLVARATDLAGRRLLLAPIAAGQLVLVDELELPEDWELIAVGHPGAKVRIVADAPDVTEPERARARAELLRAAHEADWCSGQAATDLPRDLGALCRHAIDAHLTLAAEELERMRVNPERDHRRMYRSLAQLSDVADTSVEHIAAEATAVAYLDTCLHRLAAQLRADWHAPRIPNEPSATWVRDRIESVGVRTRVVVLGGTWSTRAGLTMLAFRKDTNQPVLLIPRGSNYRIFDPVDGSERKFHEARDQLAPTAYTIYQLLPPGKLGPAQLGRILFQLMRPDLPAILLLTLMATLFSLAVPYSVGLIYNQVLPTGEQTLLIGVALLMGGAIVVSAGISAFAGLARLRLENRADAALGSALIDRLLGLPSEFLRQYSTGDLAQRIAGLSAIRSEVVSLALSAGLGAVMSVVSLVLLFFYSGLLAIVVVVVIAIFLAVALFVDSTWLRYQTSQLEKSGELGSAMYEWLIGINKIQVAAAQRRVMLRWAVDYRVLEYRTIRSGKLSAWSTMVITILPSALAVLLYLVAGKYLVGQLSVGNFMAFSTAMGQFTGALLSLTGVAGVVISSLATWRRLKPVFETEVERWGSQLPDNLSGKIEVTNVSFGYDEDQQVLDGVSLKVEPGQFVAITGLSGSGKSTLLRVMLGLERPTTGSISYDDLDLQMLDQRELRRQFGVVMQNATPLPGELSSTILGDSGGTEADAWKAAELAGLAEDIKKMPMRMHTLIGEGGGGFSGGQVQRLMIARAFARKPEVLFLDEATSALDDRTQAGIAAAIGELDTTRVVVAHRLSTIRNADRIYVLDKGRIVEQGSFAELVEAGGMFARMIARQTID